jgi:hypothetical protein
MKFRFYLLIALIILHSPVIFSQLQKEDLASFDLTTVIDEQFNDNSKNWITNNDYLSGLISDGAYILKCKNFHGSTALSYIKSDLDYSRDFKIEASFRVLKGSGGLVFGMNQRYFHYRIDISDRKEIFFLKSDTKIKQLADITKSEAIKTGTNNYLELIKLKGSYFLYINGTFINEIKGIAPDGNLLGFNAAVNSEISVDYLKASYLVQKQVEPAIATVMPASDSIHDKALNPNVPEITWLSPSSEKIDWNEFSVRVTARVRSTSRLQKVVFYVNGVPVGQSEFQLVTGKNDTYTIEKTVNLNPGENTIYFLATNSLNESKNSPVRYIRNPDAVIPKITWSNPDIDKVMVNSEELTLEACIGSTAILKSVKVMVNGESQGEENVFSTVQKPDCNILWRRRVILKEGENSIYIIANNAAGPATSEKRSVIFKKTMAEKRIALVMGNSEYSNGTTLKNPVNDANLIESTLEDLGFEVLKKINVGRDSMMASIREFSKKLSSSNVALFYYAGHGVQIDGINYLIPVDAKLENKEDCKWEAVAVNTVTDEFNSRNTNTNIVILDACRNNPYRSWVRGNETGFKAMTPPNGTIISFATSEGATAADGSGFNGVFTEELVKQMRVPQPLEYVFKNTRKNVIIKTKNQQIPTEWSYLIGDFYFIKP